ncbi:Cytochrome b561 domain-containing protein [Quillaja saponaria]|uniref:Cytochrome b561 domain-containing protein n=1 Tax=Quillaja saponaria TaxID=32244 RepID=A0AAD7PVH8_QUISA|nr:Cytochrome b561 domain-containing protein [Quillaja saponaria]
MSRSLEKHKNINKVSLQMTSDIKLHGFLLWASMGFLMPAGILTIRMSSREQPGSMRSRVLFYLHVTFQSFLPQLELPCLVQKFENSFDNNHQRIGLALYGAIVLQALIGFFRPHRGKKERSYWYFMHWILGTIISLVGIINIYTGLRAYQKKTRRSTTIWTILFTTEVSFIAFFYLFQDRLEYMQKQGVILDSELPIVSSSLQNIPQRQNQKQFLPEPCGKPNALGNLFD